MKMFLGVLIGILVSILFCIGMYVTWISAQYEIAHNCDRQNSWYVDKVTYECKRK